MWYAGQVTYWECGMLGCWECGMRNVRDVGCSGCRMLGIRDVRDVGCGMFAGMWDVNLQNAANKTLRAIALLFVANVFQSFTSDKNLLFSWLYWSMKGIE